MSYDFTFFYVQSRVYFLKNCNIGNIDAEIAGTKIISNQLGYISHGEYLKNGFAPGKWFEV